MTSPLWRTIGGALILVTALAAAACSFNTASKKPSGARPFAEGETMGKIDRLPGGTAVASDVVTLLNVTCSNGQLIVTTNLKSIAAKMDCAQQVPQATLDRFYGQPVGISYAGGRLRIESVSAGTLDFPANDATVTDVHATP